MFTESRTRPGVFASGFANLFTDWAFFSIADMLPMSLAFHGRMGYTCFRSHMDSDRSHSGNKRVIR